MAIDKVARRADDLRRIDAALDRLANGDYGYCTRCGSRIDVVRLEFDPATQECLACSAGISLKGETSGRREH